MKAAWLAAAVTSLGLWVSGVALGEEGQPANPPARTNDAATGRNGQPVDPRQIRASGGAQISQENAAQIAKVLLATSTPVAQNVDAAVSVGSPLPGDVDVRPLPSAVVAIVPEYRGYEYGIANSGVVIVEPSTRKVVEVIRDCSGAPAGGSEARPSPCGP